MFAENIALADTFHVAPPLRKGIGAFLTVVHKQTKSAAFVFATY
ncbi:MAG: hypothetical protein ACYDDO_14880 [Acidiferrobacterales bacterium]